MKNNFIEPVEGVEPSGLSPKAKILVVDDNHSQLEVLRQQIASFGYYAESTDCAEKAINILETENFDIIISDIFLPGINGIELLEYVNDHHPHSDVIIITGFTDRYSYSEIIRLGAIDLMTKPYDLRTLEAKLFRALRERQLTKELSLLKNEGMGESVSQSEHMPAACKHDSTINFCPVELQRLQEKITESELRYQKFFEHAGDFVVLYEFRSNKAKIINVNQACCRATGFGRAELIGESIFSFLVDQDLDEINYLRNRMQGPDFENVIFEANVKCRNHETIPVEVNAVRLEMNKLPYILTIARDITERKQAIKDLMESESRYRTIFENSAVGFGLSEMSADNPPVSYVDCNGTLASLAGMSKDALTSSRDLSKFYKRGNISWSKYCLDELSPAERISKYSWHRPDGKENHVVCESKPLWLNDRQYMLSIHRNVTGRIKADQKIQKLSRQMGRAVENEKKRIGMDLHDELGQKLHSIRHVVDGLQGSLQGDLAENMEVSKSLRSLGSLVENLGVTCRDIIFQLSPARMETLNVDDLISDLIDFFRQNWSGKKISAQFESDWGNVDSYTKTVIFRIIQEALNNIAKHSEAQNVKIALKGNAQSRLLIIEDDGIGFDPFMVREVKYTDSTSGGYGLVGMRERVRSLNGQLKFHRRSMGTSIEISFPRGNS